MEGLVPLVLLVVTCIVFYFALPKQPQPSFPPIPSPAALFVVGAFSGVILVVVAAAIVLYLTHEWEDLFRVHIVISSALALAGAFLSSSNGSQSRIIIDSVLRHVFFIAGSISWYGVVYSFIASKDEIKLHHYLRPGLFLAFLSYAGSLLTCPLVVSPSSAFNNLPLCSAGLLGLLSYFWVIEKYFVDQEHTYFAGSVMHQMPHRLAEVSWFSCHRKTFTAVLCLCHLVSLALMRYVSTKSLLLDDSKKHDDQGAGEGEDEGAGASLQDMAEGGAGVAVVRERLRRRRTATTATATATAPATTTQHGNDLPDDCVEISMEDAVLLTGGDPAH